MNLIQQLQATPKWKEFEDWYFQNYGVSNKVGINLYPSSNYLGFINLPVEFTKGVFEKFIEGQGYCIEQYQKSPPVSLMWATLFKQEPNTDGLFSGTFEKLLIWYFNN